MKKLETLNFKKEIVETTKDYLKNNFSLTLLYQESRDDT